MKVRPYIPKDKHKLIALWRSCHLLNPKNDPEKDIGRKLDIKPGWLFVAEEKGAIVGSVMVGYEGHRGWINYLAVAPGYRSKGFGRELMNRAEKELKKVDCPKINLQVRAGNRAVLGFYRRIGYVEDKVVSLGKRLTDDSNSP